MFALYAAGGRNRIRANAMTETLPVYHADLAALATERRRAMTDAALTDAGAAEPHTARRPSPEPCAARS